MDAPLTLTGDGYGLQISAEAQQIKDALLDAIAERVSVVIDAKPPTAGTKMEWDYEVEDLAKLHLYFPELVELTARRSAILQYIRSQPQQLPGLRVFEKVVLK